MSNLAAELWQRLAPFRRSVIGIEVDYRRATMRFRFNKTGACELTKGIANRRAGHIKLLGNCLFLQLLARADGAGNDIVSQLFTDLVGYGR